MSKGIVRRANAGRLLNVIDRRGERQLIKLLAIVLISTSYCFGQASGIGKTGGTGNQEFVVNAQTSTYQTILSDWQFCKTIPVASGTFTITLLASSIQPKSGQCIRIQNYGSGIVTIAPSGQNINGNSSNLTLQPGSAQAPNGIWITSDGTNYTSQPMSGSSPAAILSCQILDNAICTSSVDGSGNPNFLTTAVGTSLPINGGTTPLVMFINGVYQVLNTNVNLTVPSTASVQQWILALQDTTNPSMVAADFEAMNTAPFYQYTAPTCPSPSPALSSTNPSFWFDLSTNLSKLCTSNGGSYSATASMLIGTVFVDATPKVANILTEPYRLNPYMRYQQFGNGSNGVLTVTSGTTTIDVHKQYQSVLMTGGTLTHTIPTGANNFTTNGVSFFSQSPVMFIGATVTANGTGSGQVNGGTGAGSQGGFGGSGGAGGGGGGSGATSAAGGSGGQITSQIRGDVYGGGGTAGAATPTAGGNGVAADTPYQPRTTSYFCAGAGGGSGAGDATNSGGNSGSGGGAIYMKMPSILAISTTTISANGVNGSAGSAGNAAGGGGGGGGCVLINAGFLTVSAATITVSGGTGGAGSGTGQAGGNGGAGNLQENKLW